MVNGFYIFCVSISFLILFVKDMSTKPTRVCEYKTAAQQTIDSKLFDYQTGASFDGITYEDNEKAYRRFVN